MGGASSLPGDKSSTLAAAYKALQARIDARQHQPLLAAQRLWLQYRDANCGFYGVQDGSIQQVQAAECIRSMTAARARELEKAMEFDKGDKAPILSLPDVEARAKLRGRSDFRAGPMSITIERVVEASPELHDLGELNDILGAAYKTHQRHGLSIDQLFEPHVRLFLARLDGVVAGCGGVAVFDDYAEVKRMYTRPSARGRGVAKALLYIIQDEARRANKSVLRLETGTYQREAIGLYERIGFRPRRLFGPYAAMRARNIETSLFFEKILP